MFHFITLLVRRSNPIAYIYIHIDFISKLIFLNYLLEAVILYHLISNL
jgi:hypothetical protein